MRLFVAVDVPEPVKDAIEGDVVGPLRDVLPGARWTRPEGRHLTLKFLGEVDEARVDGVGHTLTGVVSAHRPFDAAFGEIGGFPNLRRPRVLWIGVVEGAQTMVDLATGVDEALGELGFAREDRPFHPHFTLARFPKPSKLDGLPSIVVPSGAFAVNEIVLFQSRLHPKGARYTALQRFGLGHR